MINKTVMKILGGLAILIILFVLIFEAGVSHEKGRQQKLVDRANAVVIKKNENTQKVADKVEEKQIEYRDRIVYKYKTIKEEVVKYETTKDGNDTLDGEFVRLHNLAASNPEVQTTKPTSGIDETSPGPEITKSEAIDTITDNYELYYQCQRKVEGWKEFYKGVQEEINSK